MGFGIVPGVNGPPPESADARLASGSVAVIGAGLAGLSAARLLAECGLRVTVVDKGRRPGGRMASREYPGLAFDHGCQYFTARDERFRLHVETWVEAGVAGVWTGARAALAHGACSRVYDDVVRYVGTPRMQAVGEFLAADLDVRCGCRVEALHSSGGQWTLHADPPAPGRFDAVVIATPAPQTLALLPGNAGFRGPVAAVDMAPCWAVMAGYECDLEAGFDAAHVSGSPLVWLCRNDRKPGRSGNESWTLHASPAWSRDHLEEDRDDIARELVREFHRLIGAESASPVLLKAHRWRYASAATPLDRGFLWDPAARLGVCGDWCRGGRVEDAFLSGWTLAERMVARSGGEPPAG